MTSQAEANMLGSALESVKRNVHLKTVSFDEAYEGVSKVAEGKYLIEKCRHRSDDWRPTPMHMRQLLTVLCRRQCWRLDSTQPLPNPDTYSDDELVVPMIYLPGLGDKSGLVRTMAELWYVIEQEDDLDCKRQLASMLKAMFDGRPFGNRQMSAPALTIGSIEPGIRWVAISPFDYEGLSADEAVAAARRDGKQLAWAELLMGIVMAPKWPRQWLDYGRGFSLQMSGLRFEVDGVAMVPYLSYSEGQLDFSIDEIDGAFPNVSSPTVRVLS